MAIEKVLTLLFDLWPRISFPESYWKQNSPPKHLITKHFEVMGLIVIDGNPNGAVVTKKGTQNLQSVSHHTEPYASAPRPSS